MKNDDLYVPYEMVDDIYTYEEWVYMFIPSEWQSWFIETGKLRVDKPQA